MNRKKAITIDIGTTNSKVSLFKRETGELICREIFKTPKVHDDYGILFDFDTIYKRIIMILEDYFLTFNQDIDSINISSVGEAGVLIDKTGKIVTPMIAWFDKRAEKYVAMLNENQKEKIYSITGLPAHSNYSIPKISWLFDHYELTNYPYTWLNLPDLLAYKLTGTVKTEFSMASRTMALDLKNKIWSEEILDIFNLTGKVTFPDIQSSGEIVGYITASLGDLFKQNQNITVRIAGHDHMVGALSMNLSENKMLNSTGTTEGLLTINSHLVGFNKNFSNSLSMGIFTNSSYYTLFSSMPTGGNAFDWYKKLFNLSQEDFLKDCEILNEEYLLGKRKLSEELLFVPHLNGSGAPYKFGASQAIFYGMKQTTERRDILFGVLLGLCMEMKLTASCFNMQVIDCILAIGPVIKNPLWLQMKADALNLNIEAVEVEEAVSFGALKAAYADFNRFCDYKIIKPIEQNVRDFNTQFLKYQDLYDYKKDILENNYLYKLKSKNQKLDNDCFVEEVS
ncbi:hypothetical protein IGI65_000640 [Enterococcus sp. DIV0755b]|uniref:FGGY-family carbohydrate kinase n=1 Tax=Enterococcus sp. DIV0755b TaxID=2774657 RepID=UPI003F286738